MKRRLLCILLAFVMMLTILPAGVALADQSEPVVPEIIADEPMAEEPGEPESDEYELIMPLGDPPPIFFELRQMALDAIAAANLPDAADFASLGSDQEDGYQIVIQFQNISRWSQMLNLPTATYENTRQEYYEHKRLFTEWPEMGNPTIISEWGNVPATGIYAYVEAARAIHPGWDITADPYFADFVAFAEFHEPAARAGTPVGTISVHIGSVHADTQEDQAAYFARTGFESSFVPFRVFRAAIEIGPDSQGRVDVRVARFFDDAGPHGGPGVTRMTCWNGMRVQAYEFDLNHEGIAINHRTIFLDVAQGYTIISAGGRTYVNLGDFQNVRIPVRPGARVFTFGGATIGAGPANLHNTIAEIPNGFATLGTHIGNTMYLMYCPNREYVIQAHIRPGTRAARPDNATTDGRFHYFFGVMPDDSQFGFCGRMSPWPTDFALFDPTRFPEVTGATDPEGRYPLFIYTGGIGHGLAKNTFANGGLPAAIGESWQRQFENENPDLSGAFVMMTRGTNNNRVGSIWGQCVITGKRGFSNPLWAEGDPAYQGRPTQVYPVIANVRRLLAENPNIDPNRIYVAGFSAGGYFTMELIWHAPDLFTSAKPGCPAFFPNNMARPFFDLPGKINDGDASGFLQRMWDARHVPMWLSHAMLDTITPFYMTVQQPLHEQTLNDPRFAQFSEIGTFGARGGDGVVQIEREIVTIRGIVYGFRYLEDGNPLTRVCAQNQLTSAAGAPLSPGMNHTHGNMVANNVFNPDVTITCPLTGRVETLNFWSRNYAPRPDNWNPGVGLFAYPVVGTAPVNIVEPTPAGTLYGRSISSVYSTSQGWYGTMIEWFNLTGRQRQGITRDVELLSAEYSVHHFGGDNGYVTEIVLRFDGQPGDLLPEHITIIGAEGTTVNVVQVTGREDSTVRNVVIEGIWPEGALVTLTVNNPIGANIVNYEIADIVLVLPEEVTITGATTVQRGSSITLSATVTPAGVPQNVTWSVTGYAGVTISAAGVLTVPGDVPTGTVLTVTATAAGTTVVGTHTVTVTAPPPVNGGVWPPVTPPTPPTVPDDEEYEEDDLEVPLAPPAFVDVPGHWAREAIEFVYERGIMLGVSDTMFAPDAVLTRAMMATILWRIEGEPSVVFEPVFSDVPDGRWYSQAIVWASEQDIVRGIGGGLFDPHSNITREQFAAMMHRYAVFIEIDTEVPATHSLAQFTDRALIGDWALGYVMWANYNELLTGVTVTTLQPQGNVTRAQCATVLHRFMLRFLEE